MMQNLRVLVSCILYIHGAIASSIEYASNFLNLVITGEEKIGTYSETHFLNLQIHHYT